MSMKTQLLIIVVAGFLIGGLAGAAMLALNRGETPNGVETSGKALIGGPFTLVDQTGKTVTDQDYRGRYMLVFFGYTHCPDICPAELQIMAAALDKLGQDKSKIVPIFISVDPERDNPQVLASYLKNFGPEFVGLTGSPDQIAAAAKAYRVIYSKVENQEHPNDYTMDHSALIYLMGPNGDYVAHFAYGTTPDQMAEALHRLG